MRKRPSLRRILVLSTVVLVAAACEVEEEPAEMEEAPEAMPAEAEPTAAELPDTTAEAVWSYLQSVNYEEAWSMWPGTTALYPGTEPHGALLTTYVNPAAEQGLTDVSGMLPDDAIIVKENYQPDSTLASVTTMYKVEGYDPEHNDWFWAKYGPDGEVESAGRVPGCIECHGERADNDYVWSDTLPVRMP